MRINTVKVSSYVININSWDDDKKKSKHEWLLGNCQAKCEGYDNYDKSETHEDCKENCFHIIRLLNTNFVSHIKST